MRSVTKLKLKNIGVCLVFFNNAYVHFSQHYVCNIFSYIWESLTFSDSTWVSLADYRALSFFFLRFRHHEFHVCAISVTMVDGTRWRCLLQFVLSTNSHFNNFKSIFIRIGC